MTYEAAKKKAFRIANDTGNSVLIYKSTLPNGEDTEEYGVAFTLPAFANRVGDRVYPESRRLQND